MFKKPKIEDTLDLEQYSLDKIKKKRELILRVRSQKKPSKEKKFFIDNQPINEQKIKKIDYLFEMKQKRRSRVVIPVF